jgi:hypothetical protein
MAIPRAIKPHAVTKLEGGAKGKQTRNKGVSSSLGRRRTSERARARREKAPSGRGVASKGRLCPAAASPLALCL